MFLERSGLIVTKNKALETKIQSLLKYTDPSKRKELAVKDLESLVENKGREKLNSLKYYMDDKEKSFFNAYLIHDEIGELRSYLGILMRTDRESLFRFVESSPFKNSLKFSSDKDVLTARYLKTLEDKPYFRILEPYLNLDDSLLNKRELYINLNLEKWYFYNLRKQLKLMSGEKALKNLISEEIDWFNIKWIYRAKKYRNLDSITITSLTIQGGKVFKGEKLKELSKNKADFLIQEVLSSKYGKWLDSSEMDYFLDIAGQRYFLELTRKAMHQRSSPIMKAICYSLILKSELVDLARIAEGKSLGFDWNKISKYLINNKERSINGR